MLISSFGAIGVNAENAALKSFNEVLYDDSTSTEENKGWTGDTSGGATVTVDESGNAVIKPNGTGERYAILDITDSESSVVTVEFTVNAKLTSGRTSFFALTDKNKNNILDITFDGTGEEPVFSLAANETAITVTDNGRGACAT